MWWKYDNYAIKIIHYCKTIIFSDTLILQANCPGYIHQSLFSQLFIPFTIILSWEILEKSLIWGLTNLHKK